MGKVWERFCFEYLKAIFSTIISRVEGPAKDVSGAPNILDRYLNTDIKVNQIVTVKVISVDVNKKRIGLSIKQVK